ncbi:MAG: class I tRNA ligase family protein, partial [Candidatus Taylorbacteria bacterium]|nr:class I tRNA ligase family protein [Candidatus Taylorbacteria bacterium]
GVNRFAHFTVFLFQLVDGQQLDIKDEEREKHKVVWLTPAELESFRLPPVHRRAWEESRGVEKPVVKNGILTEPPEFVGREWNEVRTEIIDHLVKNGYASRAVHYKLRDWVFSRQRYWGEPIPVIHCATCGVVPVPEKDLPVKLPRVKNYKPTDTGESPLAAISKWVNVKCPTCKGPGKRETDTMPNWAGSSWYYLAYAMHKNLKSKIINFKSSGNLLRYWTPVDWYNGGMEHTTLHLLYSRFWHKFLFDQGLVPTSEPYVKRTSHGLILGEGGVKMSKSLGNVVSPDSLIERFGADTLRLYEMFMGPFDHHIAWSTESMLGPRRFLEKVWRLGGKVIDLGLKKEKHSPKSDHSSLNACLHRTIKKVSSDIEAMHFNTAVSSLMVLVNEMEKAQYVPQEYFETFLRLLAPFAPHLTDELWSLLGNKKSIHLSMWPSFDEELTIDEVKKIVIQINGKVRATIEVSGEVSEDELRDKVEVLPDVAKWIEGHPVKKVIYVKGRLINLVVES